ncbi:MAG: inner membrane CreD family protein, partial [Pseudomonadota bacterium]
GFTGAYLAAAGATTTLIATYAHFGLGFAKRAWFVAIGLAATYAILLFILSSADYALLTGSILSFVALAITMYVTKDEDWSAIGKILNEATKVGTADIKDTQSDKTAPT